MILQAQKNKTGPWWLHVQQWWDNKQHRYSVDTVDNNCRRMFIAMIKRTWKVCCCWWPEELIRKDSLKVLRKGAWFGPWQSQIQLENELFAVENVLSHPTSDHCRCLSDLNLDIALWLIKVVNPPENAWFLSPKNPIACWASSRYPNS